MSKITHKGKQYEVGKLYKADSGYIGRLDQINDDDRFVLIVAGQSVCTGSYNLEEINPEDLGKVEAPPLELECGAWYMCKYKTNTRPYQFHAGGWVFQYGILKHDDGLVTPLYKMERAK